MNDFSKEELQKIYDELDNNYEELKDHVLLNKIKSLIENVNIYKKPPLGIIPRHLWLKNRINSCIGTIQQSKEIEDWDEYRKQINTFAEEILYCTNEWEKYYQL